MPRLLALLITLLPLALSCSKPAEEITLYTSIDEPYARPIVERFEKDTGLRVRLITDTEATKTAGLAERVLAERDRPRADVYWGNEPFHTIRLADEGVLARNPVSDAESTPARFKDPDKRWYGLGYRARLLARSTRDNHAPLTRQLTSLQHLTRPELKGKVALTTPNTGTTAGHLAALYVTWGEAKYRVWLEALRVNDVKLVGGNSVVAQLVGNGTLLAGLTDNDDVAATLSNDAALDAVLPDQDGDGTLLVPTTVALIANAPNPTGGQRLIAFILSHPTEKYLIDQKFLRGSLLTLKEDRVKALDVDLGEVSKALKPATELALTVLQDRTTGSR